MKAALTVLIILLAPLYCFAQAKKIPVAVVPDGEDSVGRSIAFALKEAIRGSESFKFVDDDPFPKTPRLVVHLISLDITLSEGNKGSASAISETIVYASQTTPLLGGYITSAVQHCGRNKVNECAKGILPNIDRAAELLRRYWLDLWKTL